VRCHRNEALAGRHGFGQLSVLPTSSSPSCPRVTTPSLEVPLFVRSCNHYRTRSHDALGCITLPPKTKFFANSVLTTVILARWFGL
jgi:hypothetical protein